MSINNNSLDSPRVYLSPPQTSIYDLEFLIEAYESNWIAPLGPQVDKFEQEFASRIGVTHAVALSSGTAALHLALLALGVKPGDRVLVPTLTFVATANAIRYCGAEPVFIDSEYENWHVDPHLLAEELERSASNGTLPVAIVTVDLFGQCANYAVITELGRKYGVPIVEDAAEALGAVYQSRPAGSLADIGCFSFNGNKIITTSGGGMLVTSDSKWASYARYLASQAREQIAHYEHGEVGYNYRLSNLLAAVGRGQLRVLDDRVAKRQENFRRYQEALRDVPGITFMPQLPESVGTRWLTCIQLDSRYFSSSPEEVRVALEAENIESRPVWKPMHLQPAYKGFRVVGGKVAENIYERGLCLPSGSQLCVADLQRTAHVIRHCVAKKPWSLAG